MLRDRSQILSFDSIMKIRRDFRSRLLRKGRKREEGLPQRERWVLFHAPRLEDWSKIDTQPDNQTVVILFGHATVPVGARLLDAIPHPRDIKVNQARELEG